MAELDQAFGLVDQFEREAARGRGVRRSQQSHRFGFEGEAFAGGSGASPLSGRERARKRWQLGRLLPGVCGGAEGKRPRAGPRQGHICLGGKKGRRPDRAFGPGEGRPLQGRSGSCLVRHCGNAQGLPQTARSIARRSRRWGISAALKSPRRRRHLLLLCGRRGRRGRRRGRSRSGLPPPVAG